MPTVPNLHIRNKPNDQTYCQTTIIIDLFIFSDEIFVDLLFIQVWDIADDAPKCVQEREMKLGRLHCAEGCPDAPFVVCMGGDKNSDNLKVLDVRESADGEWFPVGINI